MNKPSLILIAPIMSSGIIITANMQGQYGFVVAMMMSTVVSYVLKLVAVVIQQKGFGAMLGANPKVPCT